MHDRSQQLSRHLKLAAIGWAVGYVLISTGLLFALASADKELIKFLVLALIGWTPIGILMTYGEARELWNGTESAVGYVGPVALLLFLAAMSAVIG